MGEQVALVTGSSRGVGKGVALALGAQGWTVAVTSRPRDGAPSGELTAVAEEVTARGGRGIVVPCDHSDDDQVAAVFDRLDAESGHLDLLVNNVWRGPNFDRRRSWERPIDDWDSLIGIGLRAHYVATVHALRRMVPRDRGLVVNISSFGTRAFLHSVLYGVSKAGLDKMAADLAVELRDTQVSVVSLWLGLVQTERVLSAPGGRIAGFPVSEAETPEFEGRVIAALAADPDLKARSGRTLITAELAEEYGVTEEDGRQPFSHRPLFGGGPVFPPPVGSPVS
jgi:NAD(P)-dependent dehydrogenase (short-subunit alcohol dehydrogenase family)